MTWLIQDEVFGEEETGLLINALTTLGIQHSVITYYDDTVSTGGFIPEDNISRGSVEFVCKGHSKHRLLTLENYNCHRYYPYYHDYLINYDFRFTTWSKLYSQPDKYFDLFETDRLFVRPNSGKKIFTGTTFGKKWAQRELDTIQNLPGNSWISPHELILLSTPKKIESEYRILMRGSKPITWSRYEGETEIPESRIKYFVGRVTVNNYWPDLFYTMDIALLSDDSIGIVEFNNLFSAGWYDCEYEAIIKEVEDAFN